MRLIVSVTGKDRPGIIAAVTKTFYELGGNLEDASMTILAGEFAMILLVSFRAVARHKVLAKNLKQLEKKLKLSITVQRLSERTWPSQSRSVISIPHLILIFGRDRAGIVYRVSHVLAQNKLNITDLNSKLIMTKEMKAIYALLIEVDIPKKFLVGRLQQKLQQIAKTLQVDLSLKPVEPIMF